MADTEAVKLVAPESPAQGAFRKSPPRLVVPATPVVGDDYLFSPGVETPGHRLAADVSGQRSSPTSFCIRN